MRCPPRKTGGSVSALEAAEPATAEVVPDGATNIAFNHRGNGDAPWIVNDADRVYKGSWVF